MNLSNLSGLGSSLMMVSLAVAVWSVLAYTVGLKRRDERMLTSARAAVLGQAFLLTLAIFILWAQFAGSDFANRYVAEHSSTDLSLGYRLSALWAGNEGSMMLWVWVLSLYSAVIAFQPGEEGRNMAPYVNLILQGIGLFFVFILNFVSFPFATLNPVPAEGMGLNPLLQDPGMVIHPPTLYLGYVGFSVPFAYAMAALWLRRADDTWIKVTRRWTLIAWLFLSIGIIFGGQWAYVVLGWGGYWGWDPVENASLLPWLTGTAFFHSVMIQERRGMLKGWNVGLIIGTFILTIFGTFLTRSGVLASVHAFGDSTLGAWFFAFMGAILAASLYLAIDRIPLLKGDNQFEAVVSKESSFLLNNLILVGLTFAVFFGTVFPLISEWVRGVKVTVGTPYFNTIAAPIGTLLILLVGICPLIPWKKASLRNLAQNFAYPLAVGLVTAALLFWQDVRNVPALIAFSVCAFVLATVALEFVRGVRVRLKTTGENLAEAVWHLVSRNRRRWGGYVVHVAIILMTIGIVGSTVYQQTKMYTVQPGQTMTVGNYAVTYTGLRQMGQGRTNVVFADLGVARKGTQLGLLRAQKEFHPGSDQPTTRVGILGSYREDLYVILNGWEQDQTANFKVVVNPLVTWIWIGWYVLAAGTIFAAWPARRPAFAVRTRTSTALAQAD